MRGSARVTIPARGVTNNHASYPTWRLTMASIFLEGFGEQFVEVMDAHLALRAVTASVVKT
jgi:hypothetical protein